MNTRFSIEQLEQMKTHELADLLANIVLLLRRMPNVTWSELQQVPSIVPTSESLVTPSTVSPTAQTQLPISKAYTQTELRKKKVDDLRAIADDLNIIHVSKLRKDDLIDKILARQNGQGHSEQYQIQYI